MDQEKSRVFIKTENNEIELKTDETTESLIKSLLRVEDENDHPSKYILKLDKETMRLQLVSKEELVNGKVDLEELNHPFFSKNTEKLESDLKEKERLSLDKEDKILLFSPHPDDEILGACGLLYKAFQEKIDIKVVYMTSGKTAGNASIRQKEAKNGIKLLGGAEENLFFTSFPFYDRHGRTVGDDDYYYARELIRKNSPTHVFLCADIFDPNRTHKKCFDILMKVLEEEEFNNITKYFYFSCWYWPEKNEYTHILPYDYDTYKHKIYAMLEHKSQIETKFMGDDSRPFYQRAAARDSSFGKLHNHDYCEIYYKLNH